jgi:hypothetical protein
MQVTTGQENCIDCGRFIWPLGPGVSWCRTYTHMDLNDPTYRCSPCTDKHGLRESNCNPAAGPWSGRNPMTPPASELQNKAAGQTSISKPSPQSPLLPDEAVVTTGERG